MLSSCHDCKVVQEKVHQGDLPTLYLNEFVNSVSSTDKTKNRNIKEVMEVYSNVEELFVQDTDRLIVT